MKCHFFAGVVLDIGENLMHLTQPFIKKKPFQAAKTMVPDNCGNSGINLASDWLAQSDA